MLTVLLATYNGAETLPKTLDAFCHLKEPAAGWRLLVVDNGSTDRTLEIIRSYQHRLPLTLIQETRRGQNAARNRGLREVIGDLVVFTDDDVLPEPNWLQEMRKAADSHPDVSLFGGPILPAWEIPPQEQLLRLGWPILGVSFSISDPSTRQGPVDPDLIWSANMAIRSALFQAGHRFDTTIGPDGSEDYPMGSETDFIKRMVREGHKTWYSENAIVKHQIRSSQMTADFVLERAMRFGRGWYRIWAKQIAGSPAPSRTTRYLLRYVLIRFQIIIQAVHVARLKRAGDSDQLLKRRWWLNYYRGKAIEGRSAGPTRFSVE
jgi:glycosyltransferase involved in cell wall biosynthesis